jgi:hypothetical protein
VARKEKKLRVYQPKDERCGVQIERVADGKLWKFYKLQNVPGV